MTSDIKNHEIHKDVFFMTGVYVDALQSVNIVPLLGIKN